MWQGQIHRRISRKLGLQVFDQEEILLLKAKAKALQDLRKRLLTEKYD